MSQSAQIPRLDAGHVPQRLVRAVDLDLGLATCDRRSRRHDIALALLWRRAT